jgi:hypothetical protein
MRKMILALAILYPATVLAQTTAPPKLPTVGGKPLVQVKPKGMAEKKPAATAKPQPVAQKLQACLEIDYQGTAELLRCHLQARAKTQGAGSQGRQ